MPSLRVNARWRSISDLLDTDCGDGLTLAPEAARDELRQQIGKPISNDDLLAGCRRAMQNGFSRVKLYFMCGLPGERPADLDGILDMAEEISRTGKDVMGRHATVVANISNFIPKPQTPYQRAAMQSGEYFEEAHERLRRRKRMRSVTLRLNDVESTLIEAALCRGDRRFGAVIEAVWRRSTAWTPGPSGCGRGCGEKRSPPPASIWTRCCTRHTLRMRACRGSIYRWGEGIEN